MEQSTVLSQLSTCPKKPRDEADMYFLIEGFFHCLSQMLKRVLCVFCVLSKIPVSVSTDCPKLEVSQLLILNLHDTS